MKRGGSRRQFGNKGWLRGCVSKSIGNHSDGIQRDGP